jgi:hypothetical protein
MFGSYLCRLRYFSKVMGYEVEGRNLIPGRSMSVPLRLLVSTVPH